MIQILMKVVEVVAMGVEVEMLIRAKKAVEKGEGHKTLVAVSLVAVVILVVTVAGMRWIVDYEYDSDYHHCYW